MIDGIFERPIEAGLMANEYEWLKTKKSLAYFVFWASLFLKLEKGLHRKDLEDLPDIVII